MIFNFFINNKHKKQQNSKEIEHKYFQTHQNLV